MILYTEADIFRDAQMREKPVALRKVRKRPLVERQASWEKTTIAKKDFSAVGSLDAGEAGEDRALAGARGSEQS
jgi:hypothetical protein